MKGAPIFAGSPIDLTLFFGIATGLAVVTYSLSGRSYDWRAVACVIGLWAVFGIGAAMNIGTDRGAYKTALLYTLTLLCALGPCLLLASARAQRLWLYLAVAGGLAVAVETILMRDATAWTVYHRLNVEGTSTIGTARVIGAAAVVASVMTALTFGRRRLWWCAVAVFCTGLVVMVGSRGPLISLALAVPVALFLSKAMYGRRVAALAMGIIVVIASAWAVVESSVRHSVRISRFMAGDVTDLAREALLREALSVIGRNPLGLGWDGFIAIPAIQFNYAGRDRPIYPHNFLLEIFVEGGWLAGALVLVLVALSIRGFVLNSRTSESTAVLGLGIYWIAAAQTSSDINGNRTTWVMLVLGLMYYLRERGERRAARAVSAGERVGWRQVSPP
ncbi:O-antigen ligase family protein [Micromonospora sp. NPDC049374]|uniref:O-antigen ligase family protein n=1 Tax=Micromonospora sp. NPDC049374 TaxID=3154352 RepID=UPI00342255DC